MSREFDGAHVVRRFLQGLSSREHLLVNAMRGHARYPGYVLPAVDEMKSSGLDVEEMVTANPELFSAAANTLPLGRTKCAPW